MKRIALALMLAAAPALAQEPPEALPFEQFLRDFFRDLEPRLREFGDEMEPRLREFGETIGSLRDYHPPEMLPNGDILIRRKTPLVPGEPQDEPPQDEEVAPGGPIDL